MRTDVYREVRKMVEQRSFWHRVGSMFRGNHGSAPSTGGNGSGPATAAVDDPAGSALELAAAPEATPWWRRRQAHLAQSREVSHRVMELADAMQQHYRQQDQRAAELSNSLNRVSGILEQLAETQRTQSDWLRTIAERTEVVGQHAAHLGETLSRVPESLATQAEAVRTVARQLEVAQESDTQLMLSLQQFGRAVDTLGSSGTAQVEVLQRLTAAQRDQHESVTALVREHSRWFALVVIVAAVLALAGLAALAITVWLQKNGMISFM